MPFPPSPAGYHTFCQSGASLFLTVAVDPQQRVAGLGCCADTGTQAAKEGVALPAALGVAGYTLPDAPPQSDHRHVLDCQGLGRWGGGGYLGMPEGVIDQVYITPNFVFHDSTYYVYTVVVLHDVTVV